MLPGMLPPGMLPGRRRARPAPGSAASAAGPASAAPLAAAIVNGEVWLWGRGAARVARQSGGPGARPATEAEVAPAKVAGWKDATSLALHNDQLFAVTSKGRVLGEGALPRWAPNLVPSSPEPWPELTQVQQVASFGSVVVRLADGTVRVIQGSQNTRGDGGPVGTPSTLALNAAQIAVARDVVLVLDRDGAVWGWGAGWAGAMGAVEGHAIGADQYWFVDRPKRLLGP